MKSIVARCLCSCHNYLLRLVNQNPESFQKTRPFRFSVLRQQVGRFSKGIWGNKNSVILVDLPYQSSIVIPCVFAKPAVLAADLFIDIARDEQDKQVSVDKEAGASSCVAADALHQTICNRPDLPVDIADADDLIRAAWIHLTYTLRQSSGIIPRPGKTDCDPP